MKASLARELDESGDGVFVGVFGENFFAGAKLKFAGADVHCLCVVTDQVNFEPSLGRIVNRRMLPAVWLEVCLQLAIEPRARNVVELPGHRGEGGAPLPFPSRATEESRARFG